MRILFITTLNVSYAREHYFTINVFKELAKTREEIILASIFLDRGADEPSTEKSSAEGRDYYTYRIPRAFGEEKRVEALARFFAVLSPDVIHSNMIEGLDIDAARVLGVPLFLTIHVGGVLCPRGGGNGFLTADDRICRRPISAACLRCGSRDLPFPPASYLLLRVMPGRLAWWLGRFSERRFIPYFTAAACMKLQVGERRRQAERMKYATLLAACSRLVDVLRSNELENNVILLPHGVSPREALPFPPLVEGSPVKFYYVGRIQYAKGLHVALDAFRGIDPALYEFHIIGDAERTRREQRYYRRLVNSGKGLSIVFHGRLPNERLEELVQEYHVMVHPALYLEVYGIGMAEALSMGRPVLATRCGGAEMQVHNGRNGWLVDPHDAMELRGKLLHLIHHKREIMDCACRCRLPHPIGEYIRKLLSLYRGRQEKKT